MFRRLFGVRLKPQNPLRSVAAVGCEMGMDGTVWRALRGPAQVLAMKVVSLALDGESPRPDQLVGYLFCPGVWGRGEGGGLVR